MEETEISNTPPSPTQTTPSLELGDIIEIAAPTNTEMDEQVWAIVYIDNEQIRLINTTTFLQHTLQITDGTFSDESIQQVSILCRCKEKGYARQNSLLMNTWVDVHFGGEAPTIISGEITNLEEDMIEITTFPERTIIYIDFEYKGLPLHIPIEKIVLRDRPESLGKTTTLRKQMEEEEEGEIGEEKEEAYMEYTETGEARIFIPEDAQPKPTINDALRELYLEANEFVEEEIVEITRIVEVPESERRYTLDAQIIDMTDEFVSAIPAIRRTARSFQIIQNLIHKFRELRKEFSTFDLNGNVSGIKSTGILDKPLVKCIDQLNTRLLWLLPVATLQRDIHYTAESNKINQIDVNNVDAFTFINELQQIQSRYTSNGDVGNALQYDTMIRALMSELTAFHNPISSNNILYSDAPVNTPMEAVVYNSDNFNSTVIKNASEGRTRFVIQRYGLGEQKIVSEVLRTGKKVFFRKNIVPNDSINIRSILVFPEQFIEYSRVNLPGTSIMDRSWYSTQTMDMFRMLKRKTSIQTTYITDITQKQKYDSLSELPDQDNTANTFFGNRNTIREYALDPDVPINSATFRSFLTSVFPEKRAFIDYAKTHFTGNRSVYNMIQIMEPFLLYNTDITFNQYKEMRYFVKESVKSYKSEMKKKEDAFGLYQNATFDVSWKGNRIENILHADAGLESEFRECYNVKPGEENAPPKHRFPSELLHNIYALDGGRMYLLLINKMLLSLITPDKIVNSVEVAKLDDMTNMEKIRASDCFRRHIVKKYKTIDALRKDNDNDDVYYDKEYDDTPYDILKKYKDKKKELLPELFFAYFREVLVAKHDCPESMASELAETIIVGKKRVKEGYALLELRPTLPENVDETKLTPNEREQISAESEARKLMQYYKRVNAHWVRDKTVDETSFIDNNTLMCDISRECIQTTPSKVCAPNDTAAMRMKAISANRMLKEFDYRLSLSLDEIEKNIDTSVKRLNVSVFRKRILTNVLERKFNDYAVSLGKRAIVVENVESPYEPLRRIIVAQADFVKRQTDIVRFVENFTREPMPTQNEDPYWLYCKDTNTKLFPLSMYTLARAFVMFDTYHETLDRLCSEIGILSSDGDSIIDKHTQYVLRAMDFVSEEGYDESGFRIVTNQILTKDLGDALQEALTNEEGHTNTNIKDRVFDSEEGQYAYNVFATISGHVGIRKDAIESELEEFVLRITLEIMNDTSIVLSEKSYMKRVEKRAKEAKDKPLVPYKIYRNQLLILSVGCSTAIALMTLMPSFKTKKTFPGCVQSFRGYPVDAGDEDLSGLKYISCILGKSKSSIVPWNSIDPWSATTLLKRMKEFIGQQMLARADIQQICKLKRDYLLTRPDDAIPANLNVSKWIHFMPPLVDFTLGKSLHSVGAGFEDDLLKSIRDGSRSQFESIGVLRGKIAKHVYGIVEMIKEIVSKKELLLTTSSKEPFMENACCNENPRKIHPLSYFIGENAVIDNYLKKIGDMAGTLMKIGALSKPQIMFHNENTAIRRGDIRSEMGEASIYQAFIHYCNFDRDIPIPKGLEVVCSEKPAVYDRMDSLEVKIEKMKANGKRFSKDNVEQLMNIMNRKNRVSLFMGARCEEVSQILKFKDALEELDLHHSEIIESKMRELLWATLADYNPRVMVHETRDSVDSLNRYLHSTNGRMFSKITDFLNHHCNLSDALYDRYQVFIHEICEWKNDSESNTKSIFAVRQYILNSIEKMVKVYPSMSKHFPGLSHIPKHWGLAVDHAAKIHGMASQYNNQLSSSISKPSLAPLFEHIESRLKSMMYFVKHIPVFAPIVKDGVAFHSLYSKETVYSLFKYCWYSVLYEYIIATEDPEIMAIERVETIQRHRFESQTQEQIDDIFGEDSDNEGNPLLEVQLEMGDIRKLKDEVGTMLVLFLNIDKDVKDTTNMTYEEIKFKSQRKKDKEKKQITDTFERMERDERKVEDMLKHFKIGRWNIGQQKGLFQYSGETYARQSDLNAYLNSEEEDGGITLAVNSTQNAGAEELDVEDLEREDAMEVDREYEDEANNIFGLDEDYTDGRHYDEDMGDDFTSF